MSKRWNIPVTEKLDARVEEIISKDSFKTKSEFIRDAVRRALETMEEDEEEDGDDSEDNE